MPRLSNDHIAIIGFGAIAQTLVGVLCEKGFIGALTVFVRPARVANAKVQLAEITAGRCGRCTVVDNVDALLATGPNVVVECAGQEALAAYGPNVVAQGTDLIVASVGALADDTLLDALKSAARKSNAQITLPAGAIGGIDALAAAKIAGVTQVNYTGRKPPSAWAGSPAEKVVDLEALTSAHVFFDGTAREAALAYPKNANVAATLALAGVGMDATNVRLIADPGVTENTHEYRIASEVVDFSMTLIGKPSPLNPKTSQSTVYSLARAVLNRSGMVVI